MVNRGNFHEVLSLSDSQAAEFIRVDQSRFVPARGVFKQLEGVLRFKCSTNCCVRSGSNLHKCMPVNLATKTSASSIRSYKPPQDSVCGRVTYSCQLRDRKSTRLNSSHSSISYAVFCLKKKKPLPFVYFVISAYFYSNALIG